VLNERTRIIKLDFDESQPTDANAERVKRQVPAPMWASPGAGVGRVPVQMWAGPGADVGRVPVQMWAESRRRCGQILGQMWIGEQPCAQNSRAVTGRLRVRHERWRLEAVLHCGWKQCCTVSYSLKAAEGFTV
jgi:hypothetical protein